MTSPSKKASAPESIVTSLEWAKKLKSAGYPQGESRDTWSTTESGSNSSLHERVKPGHPNYGSPYYCEYDAPYAEEILRRLPPHLLTELFTLMVLPSGEGRLWAVDYEGTPHGKIDESIANAAAAMWVFLKEHNLLPND